MICAQSTWLRLPKGNILSRISNITLLRMSFQCWDNMCYPKQYGNDHLTLFWFFWGKGGGHFFVNFVSPISTEKNGISSKM